MPLYACPVCSHMPNEHGPEGCRAGVTYAGDANPRRQPCGCCAMIDGELVGLAAADIPGAGAQGAKRERVDYASPAHVAPPAGSTGLTAPDHATGLPVSRHSGSTRSTFRTVPSPSTSHHAPTPTLPTNPSKPASTIRASPNLPTPTTQSPSFDDPSLATPTGHAHPRQATSQAMPHPTTVHTAPTSHVDPASTSQTNPPHLTSLSGPPPAVPTIRTTPPRLAVPHQARHTPPSRETHLSDPHSAVDDSTQSGPTIQSDPTPATSQARPRGQSAPAAYRTDNPSPTISGLTFRTRPNHTDIPYPSGGTIQARPPIHIGDKPMGIMDQINASLPPPQERLPGQLALGPDKAALWVNKIPFEVSAPPQVRAKPQRFMVPNEKGQMPEPNQWWLPIRLLSPRGDGTFDYILEDDGEGSRVPVDKILTFDCGPRRNAQMQALGEYVQAHGSAGPLRLDKGEAKQGAAPWVIVDWTPQAQPAYASPYQGYQSSPPPTAQTASAASPYAPWPPAPPAAPPPPVVPVPPPPPADIPPPAPPPPPVEEPYQYHTRADGKRLRWRSDLPDWEPDPDSVSAQPLPPTKVVQGFINSEGMASEGVTMEVADGSKMRQAVYQGDGAVQQPSGVVTQNAAPETASMASPGAIGVEGQPAAQEAVPSTSAAPRATVVPTPALQPAGAPQTMQAAARQAFDQGRQVMITMTCPQCHKPQTGPAFKRPQDGEYVQTHPCQASGKTVVLVATQAVKGAAGVQ